jgi:hypothetical protein
MTNRKLSIYAPSKKEEVKKKQEFINGAYKKNLDIKPANTVAQDQLNSEKPNQLPWEQNSIDNKTTKSVNLRLPENYKLKLEWLTEKTERPQIKILHSIILPAIDALVLKELE